MRAMTSLASDEPQTTTKNNSDEVVSLHSNFVWQKIMNITPDSFSDGGVSFSAKNLVNNFILSYEQGVRNFDFGAQSTHPLLKILALMKEIKRFEKCFIPFLQNNQILEVSSDCTFSFDTFRPPRSVT